MNLSAEDIRHIAELSRLELQDEEVEKYRGHMVSILDYIKKLNEIDTTKVPEMTTCSVANNVWRTDEAKNCDLSERDSAINSFPKKQGSLLEVSAVFEGRTE